MSIQTVFNTSPKKHTDRDRFEITCIGSMTKDENGNIVLSYNEKLDDEEPEVPTRLSFNPDCKDKVTLLRSGTVNAELYFENDVLRNCRYITPVMPIVVNVYTRSIKNGITEEGGILNLDYAMEIPGSLTQRIIMTVEVTELKD